MIRAMRGMVRGVLRDPLAGIVGGGSFLVAAIYGWAVWAFEIPGGALVQEVFWTAVVLGPGLVLSFGPQTRALDRRLPLKTPVKAHFVMGMSAMAGSIIGLTARSIYEGSRGGVAL